MDTARPILHVTDRLPVPTGTLPSSTLLPIFFPSRPEPKPCEANALLDLVILPPLKSIIPLWAFVFTTPRVLPLLASQLD